MRKIKSLGGDEEFGTSPKLQLVGEFPENIEVNFLTLVLASLLLESVL